jgi:hypothetical protein
VSVGGGTIQPGEIRIPPSQTQYRKYSRGTVHFMLCIAFSNLSKQDAFITMVQGPLIQVRIVLRLSTHVKMQILAIINLTNLAKDCTVGETGQPDLIMGREVAEPTTGQSVAPAFRVCTLSQKRPILSALAGGMLRLYRGSLLRLALCGLRSCYHRNRFERSIHGTLKFDAVRQSIPQVPSARWHAHLDSESRRSQ